MKRLILIAAFILTAGTLAAQNYIIVNSEKVFKSIDAYNTAISDLDKLAKQYQDQVDAKFAEVEALYNNYVSQKTSLSAAARQTRENAILNKEKEAQEGIVSEEEGAPKKEGKPRIKKAVKAAIDAEEAAVADVVAAVETPFEEPAEVAAEEAAVVAEEAAEVAAEEVAEAKAE